MKQRGGPIRFLLLVIGGWIALRTVMLWPPTLPASGIPVMVAETPRAIIGAHRVVGPREGTDALAAEPASLRRSVTQRRISGHAELPRADPVRVALALLAMTRFGAPVDASAPLVTANHTPPADFPTAMQGPYPAARWSASFWLVARNGRGIGADLSTGQIGGSQAGARIAYSLSDSRQVALIGRFATPLVGRGKQAALGVEWQPTRLPVRLIVEQRLAIDGGGGGPAVGLVGGFGPTAIARGFRLEAYGQGGAIKANRVIGYADGAVRLNRQVAMLSGTAIDLGAGGWGAIQPGAARIDLGPSIGVRVPISSEHVRFSLDWRQRVAGNALPGSGPALSIGADF